LDPETHKFTDGSFSDPLIKPSHIPAASINLILDNLQSFIIGLGLVPNNHDTDQLLNALANRYSTTEGVENYVAELCFPVGGMLFQYPDEQTPVEAGLPGTWEIWSSRAIIYGIGTSASTTQSYVERQACGNPLTAADLAVGAVITSGTHTGKYVTEKITPAGSFFGVEGGNRPAFVSGGRQEDRIRNIEGSTKTLHVMPAGGSYGIMGAIGTNFEPVSAVNGGGTNNGVCIDINAARVVPTGSDNAGPNISCRVWRRIPDINN
jgi:hypothetical protein